MLRISDFCITGSGGTPSRRESDRYYGGTIPWVKSGELRESLITKTEEFITEEAVQETSVKMVPSGALLLAMYGATVGRLGILGVPGTTNQAVCHIVPDPKIADTRYLFHALSAQVPSIVAKGVGGAQPNISQGIIRDLKVSLPPLPEQRRIAEVLDRTDSLRAHRLKAIRYTNELMKSTYLEMFGDPISNPKGWPKKPIKEIGRVITGNTPPRVNPENYGHYIEWIKSDNINSPDYYLTPAEEMLSEVGMDKSRVAPKNSILVTCIAGSPECIGNAAMTNREVAFNQQINALIPSEGDPHFFYNQILVGKRLIQAASTNGMKGMVSKGRFEQIYLCVPPESFQRIFAQRILDIDQLKTLQLGSLTQLDSLFESLQHRSFRGEL